MAKYTFQADLSVKGIKQLKEDILRYKNRDLKNKCELLIQRLLLIGVEVAQAHIDESPLGDYVTLTTNINPEKVGCNGIILAKGEVFENEGYKPFSVILAIEFGAGIYYNEKPNPDAIKYRYGVGTFPGQTHAFEDMWFYWDESEETWKATHGVKATMPMHNTKLKIIEVATEIAKEVFG